jgi:hypothetical protein
VIDPRWQQALGAAALLAVNPPGLGGVVVRAAPGPVRDAWLEALTELLAPGTPIRRIPPQVPDSRLLGGLDLTATLHAGRPVAERGLLAEADGGVVLVEDAVHRVAAVKQELEEVAEVGLHLFVVPEGAAVAVESARTRPRNETPVARKCAHAARPAKPSAPVTTTRLGAIFVAPAGFRTISSRDGGKNAVRSS